MLHIITPVKDSIELTIKTIEAVVSSSIQESYVYTIYNDCSSKENRRILEQKAKQLNCQIVNIEDITSSPSPNYLLILQMAQQEAIAKGADLMIVESDVVVGKDTIEHLSNIANATPSAGIVAAVTVDEQQKINYPYLFAQKFPKGEKKLKRHLSFCCSLLTNRFLKEYDFHNLNPKKTWFDVTISQQSLKHGFTNILSTTVTAIHRPHSSRPWKLLKYTNPWKYYWRKIFNNLDKI